MQLIGCGVERDYPWEKSEMTEIVDGFFLYICVFRPSRCGERTFQSGSPNAFSLPVARY